MFHDVEEQLVPPVGVVLLSNYILSTTYSWISILLVLLFILTPVEYHFYVFC